MPGDGSLSPGSEFGTLSQHVGPGAFLGSTNGPEKSEISIDFFEFFEGPGLGFREPFGRMGNVNWVISGFRYQKCTQFLFGPRTSDFRP